MPQTVKKSTGLTKDHKQWGDPEACAPTPNPLTPTSHPQPLTPKPLLLTPKPYPNRRVFLIGFSDGVTVGVELLTIHRKKLPISLLWIA